jgi:hypothetical protein
LIVGHLREGEDAAAEAIKAGQGELLPEGLADDLTLLRPEARATSSS